jgi:cytochrome P450
MVRGSPSEKDDFLDKYIEYFFEQNMIVNAKIPESAIDEIISQFHTFLFAGTDTTAHLTTMMLYCLSQNLDSQE